MRFKYQGLIRKMLLVFALSPQVFAVWSHKASDPKHQLPMTRLMQPFTEDQIPVIKKSP